MDLCRHTTSRPPGARRWGTVGALLIFLGAGCGSDSVASAPVAPAVEVTATVPSARRTNDGRRARVNLDAEVRSLARQHARRPLDRSRMPRYLGLLLARAEFFGALDDYDRALAASADWVEREPTLAAAHLARAQVLARLHRFGDAESHLARAAELGAGDAAVAAQRIPVLIATGRLDEASVLDEAFPARAGDAMATAGRALLRAEAGDVDGASAAMARALEEHRGISPFPVAWVYMQLGLMWQREGRAGLARDHFAAAVERLPDYAPARGHLAALEAERGDVDRAVELVAPLVDTSPDPEYRAQLAAYLRTRDQLADADRHLARARADYDTLVATHPAAFADHAAHFWLGPGADPARAHALALSNLATRPTDAAYQLALDTALAADVVPAATCALADRANALPAPSAYLLFTISRAYQTCARPTDATTALTAATTAQRSR